MTWQSRRRTRLSQTENNIAAARAVAPATMNRAAVSFAGEAPLRSASSSPSEKNARSPTTIIIGPVPNLTMRAIARGGGGPQGSCSCLRWITRSCSAVGRSSASSPRRMSAVPTAARCTSMETSTGGDRFARQPEDQLFVRSLRIDEPGRYPRRPPRPRPVPERQMTPGQGRCAYRSLGGYLFH
jgi:hypothetical protein